MVIGGCAGSTGGGIKCVRAMLLIKQGFRELYVMVHPKAVYPLKLSGHTVSAKVSSAVFAYFFLYIMIMAVTSLFLTASGVDIVTAVSGTISALSNIGPGLGEVGPALNYGGLPDLAKVLLSFCMIVGRLEIFPVLVLFTSEFWKS
jgi:trk system potassium uptake protein TrkH